VRRELGIDPKAIVIGTAGRLSPVKGHSSLLRAACLILQRRPDARFLIVGSGPLHDALVEQASRLGIAGACVFTGPQHDAHELIAAMDVFVLPSLAEGIPMALLEAMALGTPVVATAVGGVPEVIEDRVSGMLVAPGDEQGLADACLHAMTDREWSSMAAARARRLINERFSHEGSGRALLAAYRSVALVSRAVNRYMGGRRQIEAPTTHASAAWGNEHPDRHLSPTERPDGATLHVVPGTRKKVAAESPASSDFGSRIPDPGSLPIGPLHLCGGLASAAMERASRKVAHWVARRSMCRLRRHPRVVAARVRSARRLLMVCHGNIIRSPFAAHVVERAMNSSTPVSIASAGLNAVQGKPAHPTAVQMANARHIDLASHAARPITRELVAESDLIFVMDIPQLVTLRQRFPEAGTRTFLLTCLAPDTPLEVADPVDGNDVVFGGCFEHITRATRPLIRALGARAH
jgi:protein-tyrosine-phosphatase